MGTQPVAIKTFMGDRKIFRIAVSPSAKDVIARWAEQMDMSEIGVASRVYEWFGKQPEILQRGILGLYGQQTPDLVRMALEGLLGDAIAGGAGVVRAGERAQSQAASRAGRARKTKEAG